MVDYHIHTNHSIDADGCLRDYCEKALAIGLKEICFTNHCELDEERNDNLIRFNGEIKSIDNESLLNLQSEIFDLKEHYRKKGLDIKFGIEVGFFDGVDKRLKEVTNGVSLDYLLAGIHCLDHICIDSSKECNHYFEKHSAEELLNRYFTTMEILVRSRLFDAVAHFDVYKKYGLNFYGEKVRDFDREYVYHIFKLMAEYGTGLEINTAGLRRYNAFYPSIEFIQLAREAGIEIITVGSDSHKVEDLGKGITDAFEYARSSGFSAVYRFNKRHQFPLDIK
uniref:Histidinol-phosphatase n=1 Tax=candidate division WOR-3 bacterium TaxID=2052148 RepID=A0A7V0Z4K1_UNCW3